MDSPREADAAPEPSTAVDGPPITAATVVDTRPPARDIAGLLILPLAAVGLCASISRQGFVPGVDGLAYLSAATNLMHGHGVSTAFDLPTSRLTPTEVANLHGVIPLTHFPPLYPMLLAGVAKLTGSTAFGAARWTNAALLGVNTLLFERLVQRMTKSKGIAVAMAAAVLLIVSPGMADIHSAHLDFAAIHSSALSEPLFAAILLASALCLERYLRTNRRRDLWMLAAGTAAAPLTRYVGLSVAAWVAVALVVWSTGGLRTRLWRAILTFLAGVVPVTLISVSITLFEHGEPARSLVRNRFPGGFIDLVNTTSFWVASSRWPYWLRVSILAAVIGAATVVGVLGLRRARRAGATVRPSVALLVLFVPFYLSTVIITHIYLDAGTALDDRMLATLCPLALAALIGALLSGHTRPRRWPAATAVVCLLAAAPGFRVGFAEVHHAAIYFGPTPLRPTTVQMAPVIEKLPPGTLIVANDAGGLWLSTGRPIVQSPQALDLVTGKPDPRFAALVEDTAKLLYDRHGYFLGFEEEAFNHAMTAKNLFWVAKLEIVATRPDGETLWRVVGLRTPH